MAPGAESGLKARGGPIRNVYSGASKGPATGPCLGVVSSELLGVAESRGGLR